MPYGLVSKCIGVNGPPLPPNNRATDSRTGCTPQETPSLSVPIDDGTPTDAEVREAAQKLMNGRAPGALEMHAKDVKRWLNEIRLKADPESGMGTENVGDNWHLFLKLTQAVWDYGNIPPQLLLWVIVVLITKGDGNY
jgi:hypothetical protein